MHGFYMPHNIVSPCCYKSTMIEITDKIIFYISTYMRRRSFFTSLRRFKSQRSSLSFLCSHFCNCFLNTLPFVIVTIRIFDVYFYFFSIRTTITPHSVSFRVLSFTNTIF
uniref:Uncharacterized protein n=1 Tax=Lepeophtheirus salmonis TaxID=72036 RepID=A0A0K2TBT5_LEPSM